MQVTPEISAFFLGGACTILVQQVFKVIAYLWHSYNSKEPS